MKRTVATLATVLALLPSGAAFAAKVKVWHHSAPAHFEKAESKHAVVTNEGALRLSRQLKPLAKLHATHVWDVVEDRDGNLYVATGDEGKLFRITGPAAGEVWYDTGQTHVTALAVDSQKRLLAGSEPNGIAPHVSR